MRFESRKHAQDDHIDRITDCSTWYGQAPVVALASDWSREDANSMSTILKHFLNGDTGQKRWSNVGLMQAQRWVWWSRHFNKMAFRFKVTYLYMYLVLSGNEYLHNYVL